MERLALAGAEFLSIQKEQQVMIMKRKLGRQQQLMQKMGLRWIFSWQTTAEFRWPVIGLISVLTMGSVKLREKEKKLVGSLKSSILPRLSCKSLRLLSKILTLLSSQLTRRTDIKQSCASFGKRTKSNSQFQTVQPVSCTRTLPEDSMVTKRQMVSWRIWPKNWRSGAQMSIIFSVMSISQSLTACGATLLFLKASRSSVQLQTICCIVLN